MNALEHAEEARRILAKIDEVFEDPTVDPVKGAQLVDRWTRIAQVHATLATVPEYAIAELDTAIEQVSDPAVVVVGSRVVQIEDEDDSTRRRGWRCLEDIEVGTVLRVEPTQHPDGDVLVLWDRLRHDETEAVQVPRRLLRVILGA